MESQRKFDKKFLVAWNYRIIREFRLKSQDDVVKALEAEFEKPDGIKQNVSVWENLKGNPGQKYIDHLSKYLNVPKHVFSMELLTEEYLKNEFPDENHAPMPKAEDSNEKSLGELEVYRKIFEGQTEYLVIPRKVLEKTQLVSIDELANKNRQIDILIELLGIELSKVPSSKNDKKKT